MITVRPAAERGHFDHGWLDTSHTFSFADYHDPRQMGFSVLRVINEDRVAPGQGFGTHGHRDMEILTYVLDGALAHKDSLGTGSQILPGELQRMTAGTGVTHSEFNASKSEPVHFLQIWILPERRGIAPGYEQKSFPAEERRETLRLVAAPEAEAKAAGALTVHQDARLFAALLGEGQSVVHRFNPGRNGWVQIARGRAAVGGKELAAGDGAAIEGESQIRIEGRGDAEVLLFDLPP
jgi:redox-sensitive bicupin YhaK (pirin superfamily)